MQFEDSKFDDMALLRAAAEKHLLDINKPAECSAYLRGYYKSFALRLRDELKDCLNKRKGTR